MCGFLSTRDQLLSGAKPANKRPWAKVLRNGRQKRGIHERSVRIETETNGSAEGQNSCFECPTHKFAQQLHSKCAAWLDSALLNVRPYSDNAFPLLSVFRIFRNKKVEKLQQSTLILNGLSGRQQSGQNSSTHCAQTFLEFQRLIIKLNGRTCVQIEWVIVRKFLVKLKARKKNWIFKCNVFG
jgi:hypothetical protein